MRRFFMINEKIYSCRTKKIGQKEANGLNVYRIKNTKDMVGHTLTKSFDPSKIKTAANTQNLSISQYILLQIFNVLAEQRAKEKQSGAITASIQIDCRSFFPSKTLRNFATGKNVLMPETENSFEKNQLIKEQFNTITKENIYEQLYAQQAMYQHIRYLPRTLSTMAMNKLSKMEAANTTTGLSNLGVIKLPEKIECQIEKIAFLIAIEKEHSNFFSCVTIGNTLTLTGTYRGIGKEIAEKVLKQLRL